MKMENNVNLKEIKLKHINIGDLIYIPAENYSDFNGSEFDIFQVLEKPILNKDIKENINYYYLKCKEYRTGLETVLKFNTNDSYNKIYRGYIGDRYHIGSNSNIAESMSKW